MWLRYHHSPKKRRARPSDLTEAATTVLRRLDSAEFITDRQLMYDAASVAETQLSERPNIPSATVLGEDLAGRTQKSKPININN